MKTRLPFVFLVCLFSLNLIGQKGYITGDFHQHTTFTDGSYNIDHIMAKNNQYGLDWWANSEHGGAFNRDGRTADENTTTYWSEDNSVTLLGDAVGDAPNFKMWRWQALKDFSFAEVLSARSTYPTKVIIQGYEMNVPGHEHAGVGILGEQFSATPDVNVLAQFEYMFDNSDNDQTGGANLGWTKSVLSGHDKTIESLEWLQANHQYTSWMIPAHPERKKKYTIADFRDMNDAAPDVCFGFESMSGHQKSENRGGYKTTADGGGTFGGTGVYAAKIGGLWDAMLSEGRKWWLFASSDFHNEGGDFYPGEYQKTYTYVEDKMDPQAIVNGLRSGNSWVVMGDLINELNFTAEGQSLSATVGETLAADGQTVTVKIRVTDPDADNNNTYTSYTNPTLDHIDLIMGEVSDKLTPNDADYNTPSVSTTKVIARFDATGGVTDGNNITSTAWTDLGNGVYEMEYVLSNVNKAIYLRLRGTNMGLNVDKETDANGNPLNDFLSDLDGAEEAFADLWFYSNPIFVSANSQDVSGYITGDFHQHTTFTDGSFNIDHVMAKNNQYGLDWWANSEHGGAFNRDGRTADENTTTYWSEDASVVLLGDAVGDAPNFKMWRWQALKDFSFAEVMSARSTYSDKVIIQGYEMNVPGHEHAGVGILGEQFSATPDVNVLAQFEYMFDNSDNDQTGGANLGWTKSVLSGHDKTIESLEWLQANHQYTSWMIPAHPERKMKYTIADFRDMNDAAPDVCFGFESMSGHQKSENRGGYKTTADGGGTFGGTGVYAAKIGGLWDAMLSEGRKWWLFASSDFHNEGGDFYPGEYQKTYTYVEDKMDPQAIVNGLRSGNSWVVMGDLINELNFTVESDGNDASMGESLETSTNSVKVKIKVVDPNTDNNNTYTSYTNPALHHIDLIMGEVADKLTPNDADYNTPSVSTTKVVARFDANGGVTDGNNITSTAWTDLGNGAYEMEFAVNNVTKPVYFRLRGTNMDLNVDKETDANGNPLSDFLSDLDGAEEAFADLWFYSNPVFVNADIRTSLNKEEETSKIIIAPNPTKGFVSFKNFSEGTNLVYIYNGNGKVVKKYSTNESSLNTNLSDLPRGIYIASVINNNIIKKFKIVKK